MENIINKYNKLCDTKVDYEKELENWEKLLKEEKKLLYTAEKSLIILIEVAKSTQGLFKKQMESLVTMAVKSVFSDRNFKFNLNFNRKRNQFECQPTIIEILDDGREFEQIPKDDLGGSIIDIISFTMRVVLWSLENPRTMKFFSMDEPVLAVGKKEELDRTIQLISEISKRMGLQILIITHEDKLAELGERAWHVNYNGKMSHVEQIKG